MVRNRCGLHATLGRVHDCTVVCNTVTVAVAPAPDIGARQCGAAFEPLEHAKLNSCPSPFSIVYSLMFWQSKMCSAITQLRRAAHSCLPALSASCRTLRYQCVMLPASGPGPAAHWLHTRPRRMPRRHVVRRSAGADPRGVAAPPLTPGLFLHTLKNPEVSSRRHVVRRDAGADPCGVAARAAGAPGTDYFLHACSGAGLDAGDASAGRQWLSLTAADTRSPNKLHSVAPRSACMAGVGLTAVTPKFNAYKPEPIGILHPKPQDLMGAKALNGIEGGIEEEGGSGGGGGPPVGASATAAKRMVQAVQQFVAMLQIQQVGAPRAVHCASTSPPCAGGRKPLARLGSVAQVAQVGTSCYGAADCTAPCIGPLSLWSQSIPQ